MTAEQQEELEVLRSIFDGDENVKFLDDEDQENSTKVQYLVGGESSSSGENSSASFFIEFKTLNVPGYPCQNGPEINLDLFYNKRLLSDEAKTKILDTLEQEIVSNLIGSPMIYGLIEHLKEKSAEFSAILTNFPVIKNIETIDLDQQNGGNDKNTEKDAANQGKGQSLTKNAQQKADQQQLSKAQKRKMWDRGEGTGEKPRGWNWVDIVKHLSQSGGGTSVSN